MQTRTWRVEADQERLQQQEAVINAGLVRHIVYAPFTLRFIRIRHEQRSYVTTYGCDDCPSGRCAPGCPSALLKQLLVAADCAATLTLIPRGLAKRPYEHLAIAAPAKNAVLPSGAVLRQWTEAHVSVRWQVQRRTVQPTLLLATTSDGEHPNRFLRDHGWSCLPTLQKLPKEVIQAYFPLLLVTPFALPSKSLLSVLPTMQLTDVQEVHHHSNEPADGSSASKKGTVNEGEAPHMDSGA